MSGILNAMIARGGDPGAGFAQAAQIKHGIQRDNEVRNRNAFVQDRAFNAAQEHRNAMVTESGNQTKQMRLKAGQEHAASVRDAVLQAQTPEQAQGLWQMGMAEAVENGFLDPQQADPNGWQQIYVQPVDPKVAEREEYDRRKAMANEEWERRHNLERQQALNDAKAEQDQKAEEARLKALPSEGEVAATEADANQFREMITSADFSDAVGPWDDLAAGFFGMFDTKDYRANKEVTLAANELILGAASNLKGALSDKDIKFLQDSQPKPSDHESVWINWYNNRYLTRINAARKQLDLAAIEKINPDEGNGRIQKLVNMYADSQ